MTRLLCAVIVALSCVLVLVQQPAWGAGELYISCEGTLSNGGGLLKYQYTLKNTGAAPVTLTMFYLGTMDLTPSHYTNWTAPAGFSSVATVADWTTLFNLFQANTMSTTMLKTPHGLVPPPVSFPTVGGVLWTGSVVVNSGQQVTFGFNNPSAPWDMEWFAEHPDAANSSQGYAFLPVAGPVGVFTQGFVHGPGEQVVPITPSTFGAIKALYGDNP